MPQVTQLLRRAVQTNASGAATVCGDRRQDWAAIGARTARLASALQALGHRPGDRIGILALNCDRYVECLFAIAWGGFVFVPINTRLALPEIVYWLTDSGCTGLVIDDAFLPALALFRAEVPALRHVIHIGEAPAPDGLLPYEALLAGAAPVEDAGRRGNDLAGIFYTGGTTGRSKGVMLSHANIVINALNTLGGIPMAPDTRYLHAAPMFHLADGTGTFLVTAVGGCHCFLPRFDPLAFLHAIAEHRITYALLVPTMINMVVNHPEAMRHDLSSVRDLLYGASPMPEAVIRRAAEVMPNVRFTQAYGQTEASPVMTLMAPEFHADARRRKSAGQAVIGWDVRILDADDREVPRGTVGEICGRGSCVMLGYWNQPDLTAHTLRNGWLHTGDGGRMDEHGFVYVVDRMKDMIVSGGENVYSAEVEEALYHHADVAECAVIGVPDAQWGERVHAIVRLKQGAETSETDLIASCRARIAGYKCPRSIEFRADPLPLTGAGKILKSELRKPYWEGRERRVN
jgi:long-chain acyl-CoA synthetase